MSTAATLYAPGFPHGTVDGYRRGCHGSVCGAVIACRDVYRRYQGDFTFRRQVDAGVPVEEIYERDAAAAETIRQSDKAAARAERRRLAAAERPKKPRVAGQRAPRILTGPTALDKHGAEIARLHAEGLSDRMIARDVGLSRSRVAQLRRALGLAPVEQERRERPARHPRAQRTSAAAEVARLHGEGLRDVEIAERLELNKNYVGNLRRELGLPLIPATPPSSSRTGRTLPTLADADAKPATRRSASTTASGHGRNAPRASPLSTTARRMGTSSDAAAVRRARPRRPAPTRASLRNAAGVAKPASLPPRHAWMPSRSARMSALSSTAAAASSGSRKKPTSRSADSRRSSTAAPAHARASSPRTSRRRRPRSSSL